MHMSRRYALFGSVLLAVLVCVLPAVALAQGEAVQKMRYGVEGGLTVSNFRYSHNLLDTDAKARLAFSAGGSVVIPLQELLDIRTGLRFVRYGSRFDFTTSGGSTNPRTGQFSIDQNYIALPVIIRGRDAMTGRTFLGAGAEVGYLLTAKAKIRDEFATGPPQETEETITSDMNKVNFSIVFSAGADFPVNGNLWFVDLRYGLGLIDTAKDAASEFNWKTRGFEVLIGGLW